MSTAPDMIDSIAIHGARLSGLSRRGFLGTGGALVVMLGLMPDGAHGAGGTSLDAASPASWIEIHADSTITMRTGKCDFGQSSIYTAYRQIVAEELSVPVEAITTVISGDTDRTPDGGGTFGLCATPRATCARPPPTRVRRCWNWRHSASMWHVRR
jgi:hypothetical protein